MIKDFKGAVAHLLRLRREKKEEYRGSFEESVERVGRVAALSRMYTKLARLTYLAPHYDPGKKEGAMDTLLDLATYALMTEEVLFGKGFEESCDRLVERDAESGARWGDAFYKVLDRYGLVAGEVRLYDKWSGIEKEVNTEGLLELASYALHCAVWVMRDERRRK